jgi:cob(I)alamin adenosyltransferase
MCACVRARRLTEIQSRVFDLGAATATPANRSSETKKEYTKVTNK